LNLQPATFNFQPSTFDFQRKRWARTSAILVFICSLAVIGQAQSEPALVQKFELRPSGLELERHTELGSFFDVAGRRSAAFGYENRAVEAWVYPIKVLDDCSLSFRLQDYPLEIRGSDVAVSINVRPEATTLIYSHAAFTVRQIIFAPIDEPGIIMLLDVQSVLPMTISVSFRPRLKLMWPAGLMTGYLSWDGKAHRYSITEESRRFVGMIGSPVARDVSVMPYQEEPRDVPTGFVLEASREATRTGFIPIIITGSSEGGDAARAAYDRLAGSVKSLYEKNVVHYRRIRADLVSIDTPDSRVDEALEWAKVGVDKGVATNPLIGSGLLAGFRTSGESERPGFAWFFGRDALWTSLAINSYGDFQSTKTALDFLKKFQREDGKIPHEISQSAGLIPWFKDYHYGWASADATPLYIIAHADYWRWSGDLDFIKQNWDSILKAYQFTAATDTDGNGLIENTKVGHGWVEGGALYPPHEEIYMQGLWIAALRGLAEMADAMGDHKLAEAARAAAERTRAAVEKVYWLRGLGFYAFATSIPRDEVREAEDGPNRARRQARMNALDKERVVDEDTVLPAVPLWWRVLDDERAQSEIDHLGGGAIATDWGSRIISNQSALYDPLSYHYGSVWPLFTGWSAMAAYKYGRPQVGYQAMMANALLGFGRPLGYVTELLSGDFNSDFGRSSHHQIWSEAMVITPIIRGLLGVEVREGGKSLGFAPQLPANWNRVSVNNIAVGNSRYSLTLERSKGSETISLVANRGSDSHANFPDSSRKSPDFGAKALDAGAMSQVPRRNSAVALPKSPDSQPKSPDGSAKSRASRANSADSLPRSMDPLLKHQDSRSNSPDAPARSPMHITIAPAFPLDARIQSVTVNGRPARFKATRTGDVQRAEVTLDFSNQATVVYKYEEGTDVYVETEAPAAGATNKGLRILRSTTDAVSLRLVVEGLAGHTYALRVRSPRKLGAANGVKVVEPDGQDTEMLMTFEGPGDQYVRREITIPLLGRK
jgi:glycogen debranching enzyme